MCCKCVTTFLMILLLQSSRASSSVITKNQKEEMIQALEYIVSGYENSIPRDTSFRLRGRIFSEQRPQEGKSIPANKVFPPVWLQFGYFQKGDKRRYEQDRQDMPGHRYFVMDNNKQIRSYATNVIRIYPIKNKEATWVHNTHLYGDFVKSTGALGDETVSLAMKNLIAEVKEGRFDREDWDIVVDAKESGLVSVQTRYGENTYKWVIDTRKGFGVVAFEEHSPSEKFRVDKDLQCEYEQLPSGPWILARAKLLAIENGAVADRRLETTAIEEGVEFSDEFFELESLGMPPGVYTIDYSFSPPLTLNKGGPVEADRFRLDALAEAPLDVNQLAIVDSEGEVNVGEHRAYALHEQRSIVDAEPVVATRTSWFGGRRPLAVFLFIGVAVCIVGFTLARWLHRESKGA